MSDAGIQHERAQNLWTSTIRKLPPLAKATELSAQPQVGTDRIGGLETAQEEVLTYACAMTHPEVYAQWGTFPPSGLLLIGEKGVGKSLLAEALATRAGTTFLRVELPRLALEVVHTGGKVGELLEGWSHVLEEMPPTTVFFHELEFYQAAEIGERRTDLPFGPIMDFFGELIDRTTAIQHTLTVGSTSHPDSLRPAFVAPGRFDRVVEVTPAFPGDIVAALEIHAREAEKRAGRTLFGEVDWQDVVGRFREPSPGDWVNLLHGVLRRKARLECNESDPGPIRSDDVVEELDRFRATRKRLPRPAPGGTYL